MTSCLHLQSQFVTQGMLFSDETNGFLDTTNGTLNSSRASHLDEKAQAILTDWTRRGRTAFALV